MLSPEIYSERRKDLAKKIGHGSILLPGNGQSSINYADNLYPFRHDSTFLYYTGLDRPDLYLYIDIDNNDIVIDGSLDGFLNSKSYRKTIITNTASSCSADSKNTLIRE